MPTLDDIAGIAAHAIEQAERSPRFIIGSGVVAVALIIIQIAS